jgi:peptidoglycan/LPS O-acetylase OafA/YrhL
VLGSLGVESPYWDFLGGAVLSIVVASVSYCTFERFFLRLKDRWFAEKPARPLQPLRAAAPDPGSVSLIAPSGS